MLLDNLLVTNRSITNRRQGKAYTGYHGASEMEHGLCSCTVDNPLAKARGASLRTSVVWPKEISLLYLSVTHSASVSVSCYMSLDYFTTNSSSD